jgi:hypothetical protein
VAFAEGGKRIVTVGQGGTACVWELPDAGEVEQWVADLAPHERPVSDLVTLAQLLACGRIDETQARVRLGPKELHAVWQRRGPVP